MFSSCIGYFFDYYWPFKTISSSTTTQDRASNATAILNGARLAVDATMGQVLLIAGAPNYITVGDFKGSIIWTYASLVKEDK